MNKKVLIIGGSGLLGQSLKYQLESLGCKVFILSRSKNSDSGDVLYWNPTEGELDKAALEIPFVINLAGAGIADERWTDKRKYILTESRVKSTQFLFDAYQKNNTLPKHYIGASAIGFYGHQPGKELFEGSNKGMGFLSDLCLKWETAHRLFESKSEHFQVFRIGIVLSLKGGALPKTITPIRAGLAGYFGNGKQIYSWIHIDDLCKMFQTALEGKLSNGVYNAVSPNPIDNYSFTKELRKQVNPVSVLAPIPQFVLRLTLGEMSQIVLDSANVQSQRIMDSGFHFSYPSFELAIKDILERKV